MACTAAVGARGLWCSTSAAPETSHYLYTKSACPLHSQGPTRLHWSVDSDPEGANPVQHPLLAKDRASWRRERWGPPTRGLGARAPEIQQDIMSPQVHVAPQNSVYVIPVNTCTEASSLPPWSSHSLQWERVRTRGWQSEFPLILQQSMYPHHASTLGVPGA